MSAIPGDDLLFNTSAVQQEDGAWIVAGTNCHSLDVMVPGECEPGSAVVAILREGRWTEPEDQPAEFDGTSVNVKGTSDGLALLEQRTDGASDFWTLDIASGEFEHVDWRPEALQLDRSARVDEEISSFVPVRSACLFDGKLISVDANPSGDGSESLMTIVDLDQGVATEPVSVPLRLEGRDFQDGLVCDDRQNSPYLMAFDNTTNRPAAYALSLSGGAGTGPAFRPTGDIAGDPNGTAYGQASASFQYLGDVSRQVANETTDDEGNGSASVEMSGEVEALHFVDGVWKRVGDTTPIRMGESLVPLPTTLLVGSDRDGTVAVIDE